MSNLKLNLPEEPTYEAWVAHIATLPKSGKIGNNTTAHHFPAYAAPIGDADSHVGIVYHNTMIVAFYKDGRIMLDSGRWQTSTTKFRMNKILPDRYGVSQSKFVWTMVDRLGWDTAPFEDGMVIPASPYDLRWNRETFKFDVFDRRTGETIVLCRHCDRRIVLDAEDGWIDPEAPTDKDNDGAWVDDAVWRVTCDQHDSMVADHEPKGVQHA